MPNSTDIKPINPSILHKIIYDLFEDKRNADIVDDRDNNPRQNLPEFLYESYINKYGLKSLADKNLWVLAISIEKHAFRYPRIKLFSRLLGIEDPELDLKALNFVLCYCPTSALR